MFKVPIRGLAVASLAAALVGSALPAAATTPTPPASTPTQAVSAPLLPKFDTVYKNQKFAFVSDGFSPARYGYVTDSGSMAYASSQSAAIAAAGVWSFPQWGTPGFITNVANPSLHFGGTASGNTGTMKLNSGSPNLIADPAPGGISMAVGDDVLSAYSISNGQMNFSRSLAYIGLLNLPEVPPAPGTLSKSYDAATDTVTVMLRNAGANAPVSIRNSAGGASQSLGNTSASGSLDASLSSSQFNDVASVEVQVGSAGIWTPLTVRPDAVNSLRWTTSNGHRALAGSAASGSTVTLDSDRIQPNGNYVTSSSNGSFTLEVPDDVQAGSAFVYAGVDGVRTPVTIPPGQTYRQPTASVSFGTNLTDLATIGGAGEEGAQITVKVGGTPIGQPVVVKGGLWSLPIPASVGAGSHTFTVEQSVGGQAAGTASVTQDFGAAVDATGPATEFPGSSTNITGTGTDGASVQLSQNGTAIGQAVTVQGGTWSVPVSGLQDGTHTYTATQTAPGNIVTTDDITATRNATRVNVQQTNLPPGSLFTPGWVTFTGTGTPGGAISMTTTNFISGGDSLRTATVTAEGTWSIRTWLGDGRYVFDIEQNAKGRSDFIPDVDVKPIGSPVDLPFAQTNLKPGTQFVPGKNTWRGTGTAGATIQIHTTNFVSEGDSIRTTTVGKDGNWSIPDWLGDGKYVVDIEQIAGGKPTWIRGVALSPIGFTQTSLPPGSQFTEGLNTFAGTGTPGATVSMHTTNFVSDGDPLRTTTVTAHGTWSITTWLGSGRYVFDLEQDSGGVISWIRGVDVTPRP